MRHSCQAAGPLAVISVRSLAAPLMPWPEPAVVARLGVWTRRRC